MPPSPALDPDALAELLARIAGPPLDPDVLREPDPELLALAVPLLHLLSPYFRPEVRGVERVPERPVLLVGNHNAGITFLDPLFFGLEYLERRGKLDLHALGHDALFHIPLLGNFLLLLGTLRASHENAARVFARGEKVVVFPGGNWEAFRPWSQRHRVDFGGHRGFVRLALRHGVDIVPLLSLGGHEGFFVLRRGARLARAIRADRWLRSDSWPLFLGLPWGLGFGPVFHLPLPVKVVIEVGEPISLAGYGPADAEDPELVEALGRQVESALQQMMDRVLAEHPGPLLRFQQRHLPGCPALGGYAEPSSAPKR